MKATTMYVNSRSASSKLSSKEIGRLRGRLNDQIQFDVELTFADKNIGYIIASRMMAINGGKARASNSELMAWAGRCDEKTVTRAIANLRSRGHFEIESRCRGDRVFVPVLKEIDREKCPSTTANDNTGDPEKCPSPTGKMPVATGTPTEEVPAAEGLLKSPSLYHSLIPSLEEPPAAAKSAPPEATTVVVHHVWNVGVNCLAALGIPNGRARSVIGKWIKETDGDKAAVLNAIGFAYSQGSGDPIALIEKTLRKKTKRSDPDDYARGIAEGFRELRAARQEQVLQ
jgi:hypothetical protein